MYTCEEVLIVYELALAEAEQATVKIIIECSSQHLLWYDCCAEQINRVRQKVPRVGEPQHRWSHIAMSFAI